ncbi:MAG: MATE family efflux transporter, partial [Hyphomicrobiales bacterium]|nr:MATE family efflux transporter [Hyphomicrobiales bacterium]
MEQSNSSLKQSISQVQPEDRSGNNRFVVTHKLVLSIAVPVSFGYLTTPILGLVDTAVIGQLGVPALIGGLAIGTVLVDIFLFTFNFLRSGTVGLTAQAYGAGSEIEIQATLFRALGLAAIIGIVLVAITPVLLSIGLWFMAPGEATRNATATYFQIRMISAPFALVNYALFGWFVGRNSTNIALLLQVLLNTINIVLSIVFVLGFNWGITGVAIATVIAEILASLTGFAIAWKSLRKKPMPTWSQIYDTSAVKRMMSMNGDIMIRSFALLFAFGYFTAQGARYGDIILAANA